MYTLSRAQQYNTYQKNTNRNTAKCSWHRLLCHYNDLEKLSTISKTITYLGFTPVFPVYTYIGYTIVKIFLENHINVVEPSLFKHLLSKRSIIQMCSHLNVLTIRTVYFLLGHCIYKICL